MNKNPISRRDNIVLQEMEGEVLIYDLGNDKAFCLNETSAFVWQACDGKTSVSEIAQDLNKKFKTDANEDLVWLALDQLKKENLIENGDELPNHFAGMSRREAVRKVGLASLIALPVIMAVAAPTARAAASICGAQYLAPCVCDLNAGMTFGGPYPFNTACGDITGACPPPLGCLCFVPAGTPENQTLGVGNGTFNGQCQPA